MIKVDIVTGFLGAGKTTLINKLIAEAYPAERVALLENEFGEIGIDGDLAAASGITVKELANGCICCTLQGDFVEGIAELARTVSPDRIIIEPTGLARPEDLRSACALAGKKSPIRINAAITVVNAAAFPALFNVAGEIFLSQIAGASCIVLSAAQNISPDDMGLDRMIETLRGINPRAPILADPWDALDGLRLLAFAEECVQEPASHDHHEHHHHHDHHHETDEWDSISRFVTGTWTAEMLRNMAEKLKSGACGEVYRSKGLFPSGAAGKALKFDYVYGEVSITETDYAGKGKLVLIGRALNRDAVMALCDTMHAIHIVACETLKPELELVMRSLNCAYPVAWVPSGKHIWPAKLRTAVQETLDSLGDEYQTVLLVLGFCGNAMVGIESRERTLVLPRCADCIPLFLGSGKKRDECGAATYFFTRGYLQSETNFISDYENMVKKYGAEKSAWLIREMMANYKTIAVIDTGAFNAADLVRDIEPFAAMLGIPVSIVPGSLRLIEGLIAGNWSPDEYLVIPPGKTCGFADAMEAAMKRSIGE